MKVEGGKLVLEYNLKGETKMEKLTSKQIAVVRFNLGYSQTQFGRAIGVAQTTISRWEKGAMGISRAVSRILRLWGEEPLAMWEIFEKVYPGLLPRPQLVLFDAIKDGGG